MLGAKAALSAWPRGLQLAYLCQGQGHGGFFGRGRAVGCMCASASSDAGAASWAILSCEGRLGSAGPHWPCRGTARRACVLHRCHTGLLGSVASVLAIYLHTMERH